MFCIKCGTKLSNEAQFCSNCGWDVNVQDLQTFNNGRIKQLKCKDCKGILNVDTENSLLICPFCGSKELIIEDKDIVIERIRSRVEQERQQTYRDIEFGKLKFETEKENRQEEHERLQKFKKGNLNKIILVFIAFCTLICGISFSRHKFLVAFIALVQDVLLITSWLIGMQFIKEKRKNTHIVLVLAAFLFIVPLFRSCGASANNDSHSREDETFDWPENGLSRIIPQPESDKGYIIVNYEDDFSLQVYDISQKDYEEYLEDCQNEGFTIDSYNGTINYNAYNEEGYYISLIYSDDDESLYINVQAPITSEEFEWPRSEIAKLIPVPNSNVGSISFDGSYGFCIYVGNTTKEEYNQYVNACYDSGFDIDYRKGDDFFYADNVDGYHLSLSYEGYNTMFIRLDEPDEE